MAFDFKRFRVEDGRCAMKVGTDGVLLGAWVQAQPDYSAALDMGAGSGLVSLMLAQRSENLKIDAVELDGGACLDCRANFECSPWNDRLLLCCGDALEYKPQAPVDLIVSNPPFFSEELKSPDVLRAAARHAGGLSPEAVMRYAAVHLSDRGSVALIFPTQLADSLIYIGEMLHLKERRRLDVCMRSGRVPERTLLQLARKDGAPERVTLDIRGADGRYSDSYRRLTQEFYLRLTD